MNQSSTNLCFILLLGTAVSSSAAEIHLRSQARPVSSLVRLADIAQVVANDSQQQTELESIGLVPAPVDGQTRYLGIRELQDLLHLRGVDLTTLRFSGASRVAIGADAEQPGRRTNRLSTQEAGRAQQRVHQALQQYLDAQAPGANWQIACPLNAAQVAAVSQAGGAIQVSGGHAPWTGQQQFQLRLIHRGGTQTIGVTAQVSLPQAVVTAARPLPRGAIINASDLVLQPSDSPRLRAGEDLFHEIELVAGMETTRSVAVGEPIHARSVRTPQLVAQGDVVTVYSRAGGISVRITARARQAGGYGDLIAVETFERKRFFARISGPQQVEISAEPAPAKRPTTAQASREGGRRAVALANQ